MISYSAATWAEPFLQLVDDAVNLGDIVYYRPVGFTEALPESALETLIAPRRSAGVLHQHVRIGSWNDLPQQLVEVQTEYSVLRVNEHSVALELATKVAEVFERL
jgi:hypothetical protein